MSAPSILPLDVLGMPLRGRQIIEASAGTGKTWTLAALYLRLVLGHGRAAEGPADPFAAALMPPDILVMTFTEAATAELRKRIRERLAEACGFFRQSGAEGDAFLHALRGSYPPELWSACAYRLDLAAQWMDDAAVFTIHAWSNRMLQEHAFESASLFQQSVVEDGQTLRLAVAQDHWRQHFYDLPPEAVDALLRVAKDPAHLLERIAERWQAADRSPEADAALSDDAEPPPPRELLLQAGRWQAELPALEAAARAAWTPEWVEAISAAAASKALKGHPANHLPGRLEKMATWQQGGKVDEGVLKRFTAAALAEGWGGAPDLAPLAPLDALSHHLQQRPELEDAVLDHAAWALRRAYAQRKAQAAQFDFQDLLQRLHHAVQAPDGSLAAAIRRQFPVALVDEFQDTDPWQYGTLERIYTGAQADAAGATLVMIGDPKQAIYSFRGADLPTYLRARSQAQAIHTLDGNHRSTPALVDALNHIFERAEQPFGDIGYPHVHARRPDAPVWNGPDGPTAVTVWHTPFDGQLNASTFEKTLAECFADAMTRMLAQGHAQPQDMAVLVRSGREADLIRTALGQRGVRNVYLSEKNSVFATQEAQDLWRLLRALLQPRNGGLLRAALASATWGLTPTELDHRLHNEAAWEALLESALRWQSVWRQQGVLPALHRWLHDEGIPARLLGQDARGERRLTNLLQIGEWLQAASAELHGEAALLRHLEAQLRQPSLAGDAAQLRLESDERLVKVVTMHKSKGLQYPLVFLPFASAFRRDDGGEEGADAMAENMRLLYVALTRAERGLWLGVAPRAQEFTAKATRGKSALSALLGRRSADDLADRLAVWAQHPHITVAPLPLPTGARYTPPGQDGPSRSALQPARVLHSHWWTASFSALVRPGRDRAATQAPTWAEERWMDAQSDAAPTTEADAPREPTPFDAFPAGSAYGTLLHDLLEWQALRDWPIAAPAGSEEAQVHQADWQAYLQHRTQSEGLPPEDADLLPRWLRLIATRELPLPDERTPQIPLRLADLHTRRAWAEMGFSLPSATLPVERLDALITRHLWPGEPRPALAPRTLGGMLTGFMDLVFEHQGRYHVLDHKSNKLARYTPQAMRQAMLEHRYDVQLTLYVLALHRLLRARLPGYRYSHHVGGAAYLFLRGIDEPGAGLVHLCPPQELIETLDAWLRGAQAPSPAGTEATA